ncbi:MAG: radical SAM protein [Chitinophagaceae bacterium]|nr:radical SAM protein [Chitinophagaceae bacterium]
MYRFKDYWQRGAVFLHNKMFPSRKRLSTVMIYATDLCDSACKHCQIWTKRPVTYLPKEKIFQLIQGNKCITPRTTIGLEGGEFMLHPDALEILEWLRKHHPKFDLLSNCLKPASLIEAVKKFPPKRLWVSLDGDKDTYLNMRGKDGYDHVLTVIKELKDIVPISVMFTLTPYNDFQDMRHVAELCKREGIDMRIGVYNDIPLFDTIETAHLTEIGSQKNELPRSFHEAKQLIRVRKENVAETAYPGNEKKTLPIRENIPDIVQEFSENFDFLVLYDEWRKGGTRLTCNSIMESIVILPDGDVPVCQHLNVLIGNVFTNSLDEIFNGMETQKKQKHYSRNCNACWINFHRKYDIVLYRSFEKYFGKFVTGKMLGYYWWEKEKRKTYKQLMRS